MSAPRRFTALIRYSYDPARLGRFDLSFQQKFRKDLRERLQAECGGVWSRDGFVLRNVPERLEERARAIVEKAYPHAYISRKDDRPQKHESSCRITWSRNGDDWYSLRVGWLGRVPAFRSGQVTDKTDPKKYKIYTNLPFPDATTDRTVVAEGETQREAELAAEEVVRRFAILLSNSFDGLL